MSSASDLTNRRILALLRADARIGASAIGQAIGLSRQAVQTRIKAMEDAGLIRGYHAEVTDDGASLHAVISLRLSERPCDRALDWLSGLAGITALYSLSGDWDALAHVHLPGTADLSTLHDHLAASPLIEEWHSQIVLRQVPVNRP
jgi:Lrp/AsnC family transcriptional regulator, leucine-responsive regulatory protein